MEGRGRTRRDASPTPLATDRVHFDARGRRHRITLDGIVGAGRDADAAALKIGVATGTRSNVVPHEFRLHEVANHGHDIESDPVDIFQSDGRNVMNARTTRTRRQMLASQHDHLICLDHLLILSRNLDRPDLSALDEAIPAPVAFGIDEAEARRNGLGVADGDAAHTRDAAVQINGLGPFHEDLEIPQLPLDLGHPPAIHLA